MNSWNRYRKSAEKVACLFLNWDEHVAAFAERLLLLKDFQPDRPQLFILGLPRSGTTLIYQYIVHRLNVAYFTNGVEKYRRAPCLTSFVKKILYDTYNSDFENSYGETFGPAAPHEAGGVWGRFFGYEDYVRFREVASSDVCIMRRMIACVQCMFGNKLFVNKNVKHLLRVDALAKIYPSSRFLIVERNMKDIALSLLRGRHDNLDDPQNWWSAKPLSYEKLIDLPVPNQIAHQLCDLRDKLKADLSEVSAERVFSIRYESFCREPEALIDKINGLCETVDYRNEAITRFRISRNQPKTEEERELVDKISALVN